MPALSSPSPWKELFRSAVWHASGFGILLLLPSQLWGTEPAWMLPGGELVLAALLPLLYGMGALGVLALRWAGTDSITNRLLMGACVLAVFFALRLDAVAPVARGQLVWVSALCLVFLLGPPGKGWVKTGCIVLASVAVVVTGAAGWLLPAQAAGDAIRLGTAYHTVLVREYPRLRRSITEGGGLALLDDGYLLVSGDGAFYHLRWEGEELQSRPLVLRAPLERDRFAQETPDDVTPRLFRVADLLVREESDGVTLLVSHHVWNSQGRCFTLRVSRLRAATVDVLGQSPPDAWSSLYETQPCLPLKDRSFPFAGLQNGGRMAMLDEDRLLLTVGDHEFDGVYSDVALPQALDNDYGKTLAISTEDGSAQFFTTGHRNPQGLMVSSAGEIWLTEHGPAGGDELNRLESGRDYGWPSHTYGVDYEDQAEPFPEPDPEASGLTLPEFAWVPSIGISNLIELRGIQFRHWAGDLLVGSLRAETLFRVHRNPDSIVYIEPVEVGVRVRDLVEDNAGRIVLWTDGGKLLSLSTAPESRAEAALRTCLSCHTLNGAGGGRVPLADVVGRSIGTVEGYEFSDALTRLDGRWTRERLDAFLTSPATFAPGNAMPFAGIPDADLRAELIGLLESLAER
jgi:cytochrome c2